MNPFTKTFVASGDLPHRAQVKYTVNDGEVALATGPTDLIAGVVDYPNGAKNGQRVDVVLFGPAEVLVGGTVLPGAGITADANGKAVAATPGAGVNQFIVGRILTNGVSGDIAKAFINPHRIQG